jgi:hypothetical protein
VLAVEVPGLVETIQQRYNLVQSPAHIYVLLSQTLSDQSLLSSVRDDHLLAGISVIR